MIESSRSSSLAVVLTLVAATAITACGQDEPTLAEWERTWEDARSALPEYEGEPIPEDVCTEALVELRTLAPELEATPDRALDAVVDQWLDIAEEAMFECPPRQVGAASFEEAYDQMSLLEEEVQAVLNEVSG